MIRGTSLSLTLAAMTLVAPALYGQVPYRVKDINPTLQPSSASNVSNIARVGDAVYFSAADGQNGTELWTSDGTPSGTVPVKDKPGSTFENPGAFTVVGDRLLFTAAASLGRTCLP